MLLRRLLPLCALAALAACGDKSGTFVRLSFEAAPTIDASAARRVVVNATLAGRTGSATFGDGTSQFAIPSSAVLDVRTGEGDLTLSAVLEGTGGAQLATATAATTVVRGATTEVTLRFGGGSDDLGITGDGGGGTDLAPEFDLLPPLDMTPPAMLEAMDMTYNFGTVVTGQFGMKTLTFRNGGAVSTSMLATTTLTGTNASQFQIMTDGCGGQTLAQNQTCTVAVRFAPNMPLPATALITVSAASGGMGGSATTMLSGTGATPGTLVLSPSTYNFPTAIDVGSSTTNVFTVTNSGAANTTALGTPTISDPNFSIMSQTCQGQILTPSSGGNPSCTITVRFQPTAYGTKNGTLSVTAATGGTAQSSLSGIGRQSFTLSVSLTNNGGGTVTSMGSSDINCPGAGTGCSKSYAVTTTPPFIQLLTAPTGTGVFFDRWNGACSGGSTCGVTMDQNRTVNATFAAKLTTSSTLANMSVGAINYVTPSRPGCPGGMTCSQTFDWGTDVTVRAAPGMTPPSTFTWADDCLGTFTNECSLRIDRDRSATANFDVNCAYVNGQPVYVEPASGVDDPNHGAGPGRCAFRTIGYALSVAQQKIFVDSNSTNDIVFGQNGEPNTVFLPPGRSIQCLSQNFMLKSLGSEMVVLDGGNTALIGCALSGNGATVARISNTASNYNVSGNKILSGLLLVDRNANQFVITNNNIDGSIILAGFNNGQVINNTFIYDPGFFPFAIQCQQDSNPAVMGSGNQWSTGGMVSCNQCSGCPFF